MPPATKASLSLHMVTAAPKMVAEGYRTTLFGGSVLSAHPSCYGTCCKQQDIQKGRDVAVPALCASPLISDGYDGAYGDDLP